MRRDILACDLCTEIDTGLAPAQVAAAGSPTRIVRRSSASVLLPTLGQLARGHMLLLPIEHLTGLAYGSNDRTATLFEECQEARDYVSQQFGVPVMFEHGARTGTAAGGCGVLHAHMHLVPIPKGSTLIGAPRLDGVQWTETRSEDWCIAARRLSARTGSYLFFQDQASNTFVAPVETLASQSMRRYVGEEIGNSAWDWRASPRPEDVSEVARDIARRTPLSDRMSHKAHAL